MKTKVNKPVNSQSESFRDSFHKCCAAYEKKMELARGIQKMYEMVEAQGPITTRDGKRMFVAHSRHRSMIGGTAAMGAMCDDLRYQSRAKVQAIFNNEDGQLSLASNVNVSSVLAGGPYLAVAIFVCAPPTPKRSPPPHQQVVTGVERSDPMPRLQRCQSEFATTAQIQLLVLGMAAWSTIVWSKISYIGSSSGSRCAYSPVLQFPSCSTAPRCRKGLCAKHSPVTARL
jgi:hypothetical protein